MIKMSSKELCTRPLRELQRVLALAGGSGLAVDGSGGGDVVIITALTMVLGLDLTVEGPVGQVDAL